MTTENRTNITFIGAGNMARSLIAGLIDDGASVDITVADPSEEQLDIIRGQWPACITTTDNAQAVSQADLVVLAVKPQIMQMVCEALASDIQERKPLIMSIAAGVSESSLNTWLGGLLPIVRCMPNTPALVQSGMSGLYANTRVDEEQRSLAESVMRAVGMVLWFDDEDMLHAVTAVSGSGPAYFFLVMEAMQRSAEGFGLSEEEARLLVVQTAFGAAKLALESNDSSAELRKKVTSKGGTTEAAINQLQASGLENTFDLALKAAAQRSIVLSGNKPAIEKS
ncbi:pyrroline-5-carboxylate reductase [Leucothrix pacifica]|uniref:Pyrroline-5-carboxylate reductase n=1 Tax=Leucothrix pacifica TaxID=1247513 RepID=A0A317C2Z9_9GAMM|nr:pyrroline-5-carboxylate reductase [Leucothrix pacifica]PWQ93015.1 pyrroline-5-carboxylate reductase [Leucothrix pacifica]